MQIKQFKWSGSEITFGLAGDGPLVILRHAFGIPAWGALGDLTKKCTVAIPDWPKSDFSLLLRGEDWFAELVSHLGFPQSALAAWSLAGPSVVRFAGSNPAHLSGLILVDTAGMSSQPPRPPDSVTNSDDRSQVPPGNEPSREAIRARWASWVKKPGVDTSALQELEYQMMSRPGALKRNRSAEQRAQVSPVTKSLSEIDVPTLILSGEKSNVLPVSDARAVQSKIRNSRLVVFEGCSHGLQLEDPARFQDEVATFVTSLDTSPKDAGPQGLPKSGEGGRPLD